jgi:hypothetical protein
LSQTSARDGHIVVRDGEQPLDEGRLGEAAAKLVDQFLQSLIRAGMLVD